MRASVRDARAGRVIFGAGTVATLTRRGDAARARTRSGAPEVVVYEVELTLTLPREVSGASGLNAIAHAVEALYARESDPVTALLAVEGVRALVRGLPPIEANGRDHALRDLGMPQAGIELAADRALQNSYWNPRKLERESVRRLLERAWAGEPPQEEHL